jgi:hypothetical protein
VYTGKVVVRDNPTPPSPIEIEIEIVIEIEKKSIPIQQRDGIRSFSKGKYVFIWNIEQ